MSSSSRLAITLLAAFSFSSSTLSARESAGAFDERLSPVITAAKTGEKVRFQSTASVCQIRVQIFSAAGNALFDSAWRDGNVLDWTIELPGQPLTGESYRCVVTVKDLDGQATEKEATMIAHEGAFSFEQRVAPGGITIIGADDAGPKITLLAHDGEKGAVVTTAGDLSFRFGNFLAGKDSEGMRLTPDGRLTVTSILFSDGTILTSERGHLLTRQNARTDRAAAPVMPDIIAQGARSSSKLTPKPNFAPGHQFVVGDTGVTIGTTNPAYKLDVAGPVNTATRYDFGGVPFALPFGTFNTFLGLTAGNLTMTGGYNTATGYAALASNTTGYTNTASGMQALANNTTGYSNTASGYEALYSTTTASNDTASGYQALYSNTTGIQNTASGYRALFSNTGGGYNTANGSEALQSNTIGNFNVAVGFQALMANTGNLNIAIGNNAGSSLTTGDLNIDIGAVGAAAEANTIRIGAIGNQTRAFIAGIRGVTTPNANAVAVLIDNNGQLGTISSSRRYKFDISDIGQATNGLMRLRPVSFRYLAHGDRAPVQYGLIAEEVAAVYPEMVALDDDGQPDTVMYQFLAPMLLNEVQKQHRQIEEQQKKIETLEQRLEALERAGHSR